jgi:hypothetical protein
MTKRGASAWVAIGVLVPVSCMAAFAVGAGNRGSFLVGGIIGLTTLTLLSERWRRRARVVPDSGKETRAEEPTTSPLGDTNAAEVGSR